MCKHCFKVCFELLCLSWGRVRRTTERMIDVAQCATDSAIIEECVPLSHYLSQWVCVIQKHMTSNKINNHNNNSSWSTPASEAIQNKKKNKSYWSGRKKLKKRRNKIKIRLKAPPTSARPLRLHCAFVWAGRVQLWGEVCRGSTPWLWQRQRQRRVAAGTLHGGAGLPTRQKSW